jgi:septal ring factor EnvC (AmiA/AmiB activator)
MSKYIKVEQKDKNPVVILDQNKNFYARKKDVKISEPTQEEIEQFFPEEAKNRSTAKLQQSVNAELQAKTVELEKVAADYNAKTAELEAEKASHEKTKTALDAAQKEIEKFSKK